MNQWRSSYWFGLYSREVMVSRNKQLVLVFILTWALFLLLGCETDVYYTLTLEVEGEGTGVLLISGLIRWSGGGSYILHASILR